MLSTLLKTLYLIAEQKYGNLFEKVRQDIPRNLAIAHVCAVNPYLVDDPVSKDYRQGFTMTSIAASRRANVDWERLTDPLSCAYAWCTDANRASYLLYSGNPTLFTTPNEDFWKCAYLKIVLEDTAFKALWSMASPVAGNPVGVYGQLKAAVTSLRASLPGWPVTKLKNQVLSKMETTFDLAKLHGPLSSTGPGRPPYLSDNDTSRIFVE